MSWSYSRYGTYRKCPAKYKFKYVDKIPEPPTQYTSRGTDLHASVEMFLLGQVDTLPTELNYYHQFLTHLKDQGVKVELKLQVNENWEPVQENGWFTCILDALVLTPPVAVKYDWKSGKIYDDHKIQRELYAMAVFAHNPEVIEVRGIHCYFDSKENRMTTYHRNEFDKLKEKWNQEVAPILRPDADFSPNPSYACRWCGFSRYKGGPCQF